MANVDYLELLAQGTETWNQWRHEHPKALPNLSAAKLRGANLSGMHLRGVDLSGADLREANLSGANLCKARLTQSDLRWANLHETNLRDARMRQADLCGAHLRQANLNNAQLREADLSGANLAAADLSMADLRGTCLHEAHLNEANLLAARLRQADLRHADLRQANLRGARLRQANLQGANLQEAILCWTSFDMADLQQARLAQADLRWANLSTANLSSAKLPEADLRGANLRGANLTDANLMNSRLVETNFETANLDGCTIYGTSVWEVKLHGATQTNLRLSPEDEPAIVVDNLEVAQFIYLQLHNTYIRDIIDTVGKRVVLILGGFDSRQSILDAIRDGLRGYDYIPLWLEIPLASTGPSQNIIAALSRLSRFVLADLTEGPHIVDTIEIILREAYVPLLPIGRKRARIYADSLRRLRTHYPQLLPTARYTDASEVQTSLHQQFLLPAEARAKELLDLRIQ